MNLFNDILRYLQDTYVIFEIEARKVIHQPSELIFRSIQPALWLLMFGQVISHEIVYHGGLTYIDFITPGILAQSVLFIAIFNGIAVIWERDMGIIQKFVVSPIARSAIILGKGLGAAIRAVSQMIIVYILAYILNVKIIWSLPSIFSVLLLIILGSVLFSTFSLIIACIVKTRERFMGIGQFLAMPLFFASNAIYPVDAMPHWLKVIAHCNPLTYEVDALRATMLVDTTSVYGVGVDSVILSSIALLFIAIGAMLYPNLAR